MRMMVAIVAIVAVVTVASACGAQSNSDLSSRPTDPAIRPGSSDTSVRWGHGDEGQAASGSGVSPGTTASGSLREPASPPTDQPGSFAATDEALARRVSTAGLGGGVVYVVSNGRVLHDAAVGSVTRSTPLAVASSAKWLTAATVLTFVDEGRLGLDDPISRWLPEFSSWDPPITVRMLLVHTSGIRDQSCLWDTGSQMADCVVRLAAGPRQFPPGSAFSYGNASYHVAGRLLEVIAGQDFATVVRQRLTSPLAMSNTTWPGAGANPSPAAGLRTTVDDYSRFLALLLADGVTPDGRRLLSSPSINELMRNQVGSYDTHDDYSVRITGIPRYALGAWPDVVNADGDTVVVSGNGGRGFYPWIDLAHRTYGVIGVQDDRGAELAVPASQAVFRHARAAYAEA